MEDEEIEEWVEQEKERLQKEYYQAIRHGKDLEKAKKRYDAEMKDLLKDYEKKYHDMWRKAEKDEALYKPINELKEKLEKRKQLWNQEYGEWKEGMMKHWNDILEEAEKKKLNLELRWHQFLNR